MSFFKVEEFAVCSHCPKINEINCDFANQKLLRHAEVVYGFPKDQPTVKYYVGRWASVDKGFYSLPATHKALIINIEPIEKCKHEQIKVNPNPLKKEFTQEDLCLYECSCGAKVKPIGFEEV